MVKSGGDLPDQIEIKTGLANNTFDVVSLGEVGIIGNRKLTTISISSYFPKNYSSYCQYYDIPEPYAAVATIERWRDSKKPIKVEIAAMNINKGHKKDSSSINFMIEEFNYREKGGQPGDVYYDLSLKEYRYLSPRVTKKKPDGLSVSLFPL
jgi:hypothetical protein